MWQIFIKTKYQTVISHMWKQPPVAGDLSQYLCISVYFQMCGPRGRFVVVQKYKIGECKWFYLKIYDFLIDYNDVIMTTMASQITNLTIVYSDADQRNHQSSASLAQRASYAENVSIWWRHHAITNEVYGLVTDLITHLYHNHNCGLHWWKMYSNS